MNARLLRALGLVVALAAALTWGLLADLAWPARAFTTFLLVPLPALLLLQTRLVGSIPGDEERESVYVSSAISVWTLAGFAMLTARFGGLTRADLWLTWPGTGVLVLATAATLGAGLALMALARWLRLPESPLTRYLMPRSASERIAFAGLSVSAGIAEELVFRAFLIAALLQAGAGLEAAAGLSVTVFALSHAYQGLTGITRVALLGALLTAPILLTGSIYPAMLAHALLDLTAGLVLADWLTDETHH